MKTQPPPHPAQVDIFAPIPETTDAPTAELWTAYNSFNEVYRGNNTQQALRSSINAVLAIRANLSQIVRPWPKFIQDECLEVLRNMDTELSAMGRKSARIERLINAIAGLPAAPETQETHVDIELPEWASDYDKGRLDDCAKFLKGYNLRVAPEGLADEGKAQWDEVAKILGADGDNVDDVLTKARTLAQSGQGERAPAPAGPRHGDDAGDGLRYVLCKVGFGERYKDWLLIPHADGQYVTAAKLAPFSMSILEQQLAAALDRPVQEVDGYVPVKRDLLESCVQMLFSASGGKENVFAAHARELMQALAASPAPDKDAAPTPCAPQSDDTEGTL